MTKKKNRIVQRWDAYFGDDILPNWQRLMADLGIDGQFSSKTQCRKALKGIWVNIHDFLDAVNQGQTVRKFNSERALSKYTLKTNRVYPKKRIVKGSPLASLMAHIL